MKLALTALAWIVVSSARATPEMLVLTGDTERVHDPVIIRERGFYYVFATGGSIRRSRDLRDWRHCGRVFEKLPDWALKEIPGTRGGYWAPDISFHDGVYRLYYSVSTFGKNDSAIGLATNRTLDPGDPLYRWEDQGLVFRSRGDDDFNAIDPNLAVDLDGRHWLVFGSFWGGIKMRSIDPGTGKLSGKDTRLYALAGRKRSPKPEGGFTAAAVEAPTLVRRGGWYYLFVSHDYCCRGAKSNYHVVGRARNVTGPFVDAAGRPLLEDGGTRLTANTSLWRGPGHQAVLLRQGGPALLVFHSYDGTTGRPHLKISTLAWENGWPRGAPLPGDPLPE